VDLQGTDRPQFPYGGEFCNSSCDDVGISTECEGSPLEETVGQVECRHDVDVFSLQTAVK